MFGAAPWKERDFYNLTSLPPGERLNYKNPFSNLTIIHTPKTTGSLW